MSTKRMLLAILTASAVLLALGIGSQLAGAQPPAQAPSGFTIPYPGRLNDAAGQPVLDGTYDFTFTLYDVETGGMPLWSETQAGVSVQGGAFQALLGAGQPIPPTALDGGDRWLEVAVRGPGEAGFTALTPRQRLSAASTASDSASVPPSCPHDHFGETWSGISGDGLAIVTSDSNANAIEGSIGPKHVVLNNGVFGETATGNGVYGRSNIGLKAGVYGYNSSSGSGVYGHSISGYGGFFSSETGTTLYCTGIGSTVQNATLKVYNTNSNHGMAAFLDNNSDYHTAHFKNTGLNGGVLFLQNFGLETGTGGGDFITAVNWDGNDLQFRVTSAGQGRSDVGFTTPAEDFAEMLPAIEGLEPGDVLVIGPDGKLTRSAVPYQVNVAGVYSTQPGFVGGHPVAGAVVGTIPLAVVGVVPVKVSAENGAIQPGDLLVASSIPGHAMKAGPSPPQGTVIGKALELLDASQGTGVIRMLAVLQ